MSLLRRTLAPSSKKPAKWPVSPGRIEPEWRWFWDYLTPDSMVCPAWEGGGPIHNLVSGGPSGPTPDGTNEFWAVGSRGVGVELDPSAGGNTSLDLGDFGLGGTAPVTIFTYARWDSFASGEDSMVGSRDTFEITLRQNAGAPEFILNSFSSNDRVAHSDTFSAGDTVAIACGYDDQNNDLWVAFNGSVASVSPSGTYANDELTIGSFTTNNQYDGHVYWFAVIPGVVPPELAAHWTARDPFGPFRMARPTMVVVPVSVGLAGSAWIEGTDLHWIDANDTEQSATGTEELFFYLPGDSGGTHTRTSVATYRDASGVLQTASSGTLRDGHHVDDETATQVDATKLEASRTNNLTQSEDFSHADWTASDVTVTANAGADPEGNTGADNLSDTASGAHGFVSQGVTVADDSLDDAASAFLEKKGADHVAMVGLEFTGGTTELTYEAEVNLNGGATDVSNSPDAPTRVVVEDWDTFWRVSVVGANNGTGNTTGTVKVYPHVGTTLGTRDTSAQGEADAWGAQHEDGAFPSSYFGTTTAAGTREADSFSFDITGTELATPQEMTGYLKFVDLGVAISDGTVGVLAIGDTTNLNERVVLFGRSNLGLRTQHHNGTSDVFSTVGPSTLNAEYGSVIEALVVLRSDGSIQLKTATDGGAVQDGGQSGANALPAGWNEDTVVLGSNGTVSGFSDSISLKIASGVHTMDTMRNMKAGSVWIDGADLHYLDADAHHRVITGTDTTNDPAGAIAGSAWIEGANLHYIDASGNERTIS